MRLLIYILILVAKIIEVSLATTRIVLITRGERTIGAIIGFFEVLIWVSLVSTVLKDITSDPFKLLVYALGFALGNYVGSMLEQRIGIGTIRIEVIVMEEQGTELVDSIRKKGFAVTVMDAKGMDCERSVLLMNIPRKKYREVVKMIKAYQSNVVITINDIKPVYGGYGILKR